MSRSTWEAEATAQGFKSEEEMWKSLYPKNSIKTLAEKFDKGINTIRARLDYYQIEKKSRGGANNVKVEVDATLLQDVVEMGVFKAAMKRGIKPQTLYQRLYYKYGVTVKGLQEQMRKQSLSSPECDNEQPSSEESPLPPRGDK